MGYSMLLEKGQILQNRYEILEKIGSGGMAVVYKAIDNKLARNVAIKVLREEFATDEEFITRFINEAQAAARLSHPNIVNVYDVENYNGIYFIVMELVEGKTLKELIDEKAPFDETSALSVAHQIASALYIAHTRGIIHRDIKPQNILVVRDGSVKVADFGIARATTTKTISSKAGAIGSVHYFSPEQAKGDYVDGKSDLYSLGIVMYEMLSGRLPYDGESSVEVALKHLNEDMPPLSGIEPNLSESVIAIVEKATEKRRDLRYNDILDMMQDLKKALTDKSGYFVVKKKIDQSNTIKFTDNEFKQIQDETQRLSQNGYSDGDEEEYEREEDSDTGIKKGLSSDIKLVIAASVTALIIIIIISFSVSRFLFAPKPPATIVMPNLIGAMYEDAEFDAQQLGIPLEKNEINDNTIPVGEIISQGVEEGVEIIKGDIVGVTVSLGPVMYDMPRLEMLDQNIAYEELANLPFNILEPIYEFNDNVAYGIVIRQVPEAGASVPETQDVQIYVSKGPEQREVMVPDVVGKSEEDAITLLEGLGFTVSTSKDSSTTYSSGKVISQSRNAGTMVREGVIVDIVISTGPPAVEPETETPAAETQAPATKTIPYQITPGSLPEGTEKVHVRLDVTSSDTGVNSVMFDQTVDVSEFPLFVPVTGSGFCEVSVYIDNVMQWRDHVNFDE